jgi:hypothetical protein
MTRLIVEDWEIPKTFEQAQWFWRGRQEQFFEESCAFPVGERLHRQCRYKPGYGPDNLFCIHHAKKL